MLQHKALRLRRLEVGSSAEIHFDEKMTATVSQGKFLSNERNKCRIISMMCNRLTNEGFRVKQADDADTLIVNTAIENQITIKR